jgi:glycosyltransferase involved in cell wall biosynthesis
VKNYIIYVPNEIGGVKNVTYSLSIGLQSHGHSVKIVNSIKGLLRAWIDIKSPIFISSLSFGIFNPLFKRSIYILHGFPMKDTQNIISAIILRGLPRYIKFFKGKLIAVSHLTREVHERIYGILTDAVIHNGVSSAYYNDKNISIKPKQKIILYVGRIVEGKGIRSIINGFISSKAKEFDYKLIFVGVGSLYGELSCEFLGSYDIIFKGEVSENEKVELMKASEIFISLNSFEPMGVVFAEAIVSNCKIVAPFCGGYREFIPTAYPFFGCDPRRTNTVALAIDRAIQSQAGNIFEDIDIQYFSYEYRVAPDYERISFS